MKPSLLFVMIMILAYLKGDEHSFSATRQQEVSNYTDQYNKLTVSGTNTRSFPTYILVTPVLCDDDDDEFELVKKKTFIAIPPSAINKSFEKNLIRNVLKRSHRSSEYPNHISQPVYIFQRELLI